MVKTPSVSQFVIVAATIGTLFVSPEILRAQDLSALGLGVGERVEVRTANGTTKGVVNQISTISITVDKSQIGRDLIIKVDRLVGDSVWNGFAIGAAVGAVMGAVTPRGDCGDGKELLCIGGPAVIYGFIGALLDRRREARVNLFDRATPIGIRPIMNAGKNRFFIGFAVDTQ